MRNHIDAIIAEHPLIRVGTMTRLAIARDGGEFVPMVASRAVISAGLQFVTVASRLTDADLNRLADALEALRIG